ncbi:MAG: LytTR family DNA-binding domain-containing protein [Bacteroidota bacterium]
MITCIVIDDEPMALDVIERYCARIGFVELKGCFLDPLEAIEQLKSRPVDLVFLDINMPVISGMQLAKNLPGNPMVIFTTAYSHYAADSYNLDAIDYLLKPITFERFQKAVNKAIAAKSAKSTPADDGPTVYLKSGTQTYPVKLSEILYLEKDGNYMVVHLKGRNILIRENMSDVFKIIPESDFIRVHKSYVIAARHIGMIEVHQLTIHNEKIPIGDSYRNAIRERFKIT